MGKTLTEVKHSQNIIPVSDEKLDMRFFLSSLHSQEKEIYTMLCHLVALFQDGVLFQRLLISLLSHVTGRIQVSTCSVMVLE